jgi:ribosomal protein L11 methyltransferase
MRSPSEKPSHNPQKHQPAREIQQAILEAIHDTPRRLTPLEIEKRLSRFYPCDRKTIRSAIRELVDRRELMYVNEFGHTFIEPSLHKPIRVTTSIILKPLNCSVEQSPGDIVVSLDHGTSFGSGQHPTTRLCLKGLESLIGKEPVPMLGENTRALDIGTGSGVLLITALKMGIASGVGIDIDPCAISEAQGNVKNNGLTNRVTISAQPFEKTTELYDLILANLRVPTLKSLFPQMVGRTRPGGALLLSGIKNEERKSVVKLSDRMGLNQVWMDEEHGWTAIGFQKEQ